MTEASVKIVPPAALTAWEVINSNLPSIMLWATIIFTILQSALVLQKMYYNWKQNRQSKRRVIKKSD